MKKKICGFCIFMLFILVSTMFYSEAEAGQQQGSQPTCTTINLGIYGSVASWLKTNLFIIFYIVLQ